MIIIIHRKIILNIFEGPDDTTMAIPPNCKVIRNFAIQSDNHNIARYVPIKEIVPGFFTAVVKRSLHYA